MTSRAEATTRYAMAYVRGSKKDKGRVLDEVISVTGWSRDNARRRLRAVASRPPGTRRQVAKRPPETAVAEVLLRHVEGAADRVGCLGWAVRALPGRLDVGPARRARAPRRFRRRHLTPVPHVGSLAALNQALAAADARDDARRIGSRAETVGDAAARELPLLNPLPDDAFDVSLTLSCRVDAKARVCVRQSYYSVPARFAGRRVGLRLGATKIVVLDAGRPVAEHTRSLHKGSEDLVLDHYLEVLGRKPGALAGSTALAAARAGGAFTPVHQRFWDAARHQLGDAAGTRALVGVLLLQRTLPAQVVSAGMSAALTLNSLDPDLVAVEARRWMLAAEPACTPVPLPPKVSQAAALERPPPSLVGYDQLLTGATA